MITEKTFYSTLILKLPEMRTDLDPIGDMNCAFKAAAFFAAFTKKMMRNNESEKVKECFELAELLLKKGDHTVKNAVENVYVFSISRAIDVNRDSYGQLPSLLEEIYHKQVNAA